MYRAHTVLTHTHACEGQIIAQHSRNLHLHTGLNLLKSNQEKYWNIKKVMYKWHTKIGFRKVFAAVWISPTAILSCNRNPRIETNTAVSKPTFNAIFVFAPLRTKARLYCDARSATILIYGENAECDAFTFSKVAAKSGKNRRWSKQGGLSQHLDLCWCDNAWLTVQWLTEDTANAILWYTRNIEKNKITTWLDLPTKCTWCLRMGDRPSLTEWEKPKINHAVLIDRNLIVLHWHLSTGGCVRYQDNHKIPPLIKLRHPRKTEAPCGMCVWCVLLFLLA